jgi:sirohydrochlorin ferrochelatase
VLRDVPGPAVLVPAFLAGGYHVRTDIPEHVAASGHPDVTVTAALGPSAQLVRVMTDRLMESGWRPSRGERSDGGYSGGERSDGGYSRGERSDGGHFDSVVMAAAGTSDPHALRDLRVTAALLSAAIGRRVEMAYAATGEPRVASAVADLRARGARRVVVSSYLLADGLFQDRLRSSGADVVTEPLGTHPGVVRLIASRFRRARLPVAA